MLQLRDYQQSSLNAMLHYLAVEDGNGVVVVPTGAGKSLIIAAFAKHAITEWPQTRIMCLSHVAELLQQNCDEILGIWPECPAGIYSASLGARNIGAQMLFAGIQSIYKKAYDLQHVDIVLIDECHLVSPNDKTRYRHLLRELKQINPHIRVIGLTATPYRLDSGHICAGKDPLFDQVIFEVPVTELIEKGYLSPLVSRPTGFSIDTSNISVRGGDYAEDELAAALDESKIDAAIAEMVALGRERRGWMVFTPGVKRAYYARDVIRSHGFTAETVAGDTPKDERKAIIQAFKRQEIRCITNCNVLTTGFNAPHVDLMAFLRPTLSASLYVQMAGRGMRLSPKTGKTDCMVLDFANLIRDLGPIDRIRVKDKRKKDEKGQAPSKACPQCECGVFASARECIHCGYVFPPPQTKVEETASTLAIIAGPKPELVPDWVDVTRVSYARHTKLGSPDSLRVTYHCGLLTHNEWVLLEHPKMRGKAEAWWRRREPGAAVPATVADALRLTQFLPWPKQIAVRLAGKYTEIVSHREFQTVAEMA